MDSSVIHHTFDGQALHLENLPQNLCQEESRGHSDEATDGDNVDGSDAESFVVSSI